MSKSGGSSAEDEESKGVNRYGGTEPERAQE
jgi:hypothetical protein